MASMSKSGRTPATSSTMATKHWVPQIDEEIPSSQDYDELRPTKKMRRIMKEDGFNGAEDVAIDNSWESWDSNKLATELREAGMPEVADKFKGYGGPVYNILKDENIEGCVLSMLTEEHLKQLGLDTLGDRLKVRMFVEKITHRQMDIQLYPSSWKVFNDPIHGHIELHPLCVKIIDTPQFQRLRFLKQLGSCYFVYPGATHNRFEHSIGVSHLAGQLVRALQKRQPKLGITARDVLCVEIAGLCHDLGHGPFSHLFDNKFLPSVRPDTKWKHEDASRDMFDYLVKQNDLNPVFEEIGLEDLDLIFIKEQVTGPKKDADPKLSPSAESDQDWPYKGRPAEKGFLYEIVANKRNGIDVDKWDYFARDCHMLGIKNNFDHNRFIHFARVLEVDNQLQICTRDKESPTLYDMFHTRATLHRRAYQHTVTNIIDAMICEAMTLANDYIKIPGKNGKLVRMSDAIDDMAAYTQLTDHIFFQILHSTEPQLEHAREILNNVLCRKLYKCVGQTQLNGDQCVNKQEDLCKVKDEIWKKIGADEIESYKIEEEDVAVMLAYLDYGKKDQDPIKDVRFYSKENPDVASKVRKEQVSAMLPEIFAEQHLRVFSKKRDKAVLEVIKKAFSAFCKDKEYPPPKGDQSTLDLTPVKQNDGTPTRPTQNGNSKESPGSAGKFKSRIAF